MVGGPQNAPRITVLDFSSAYMHTVIQQNVMVVNKIALGTFDQDALHSILKSTAAL